MLLGLKSYRNWLSNIALLTSINNQLQYYGKIWPIIQIGNSSLCNNPQYLIDFFKVRDTFKF